jgi:hypothetical protein
MSPVERLQAAIEKLERLRSERGYFEMNGWLVEDDPGDTDRSLATVAAHEPDVAPITNDALIVTLHRTIDAQLAILRFAVDGMYDLPEFVALADAILGAS